MYLGLYILKPLLNLPPTDLNPSVRCTPPQTCALWTRLGDSPLCAHCICGWWSVSRYIFASPAHRHEASIKEKRGAPLREVARYKGGFTVFAASMEHIGAALSNFKLCLLPFIRMWREYRSSNSGISPESWLKRQACVGHDRRLCQRDR